jgi:hypothetical protein
LASGDPSLARNEHKVASPEKGDERPSRECHAGMIPEGEMDSDGE